MAGKPGMRGKKPLVKAIDKKGRRTFLQAVDGRSEQARTLRGRLHQLTTDLGGADTLSYQQRSLVERAIFVEARLIQFENEFALGAGFDHAEHVALTQLLMGIYTRLGLKRVPRDIGTLEQYIAAKAVIESTEPE